MVRSQNTFRETILTKQCNRHIDNIMLLSLDDNMAVLLVCLDLSALFATIDHGSLLRRLQCHLGISGECLEWFTSYLSDRKCRVFVNGDISEAHTLS